MAVYYYPSCKFTAFSPKTSEQICDYLSKRYGMVIQGCCRPAHPLMTAEDTAVCICNTCAAICSEDSRAKVVSLWEILRDDDEFPFPDLHGEAMTLQDCWRCYDRRAEQESVRSILRRMNVSIVELDENHEKTRFCGMSLHQPLVQANADFAPIRFIENASGMFISKPEEEQRALMAAHCGKIQTDKVVCYCVPCTKGISAGGKQGIHLLDLLFQNV